MKKDGISAEFENELPGSYQRIYRDINPNYLIATGLSQINTDNCNEL